MDFAKIIEENKKKKEKEAEERAKANKKVLKDYRINRNDKRPTN